MGKTPNTLIIFMVSCAFSVGRAFPARSAARVFFPLYVSAFLPTRLNGGGSFLKKIGKWLEANFEETILVVLLVVMSVLMFVNVVLRYVFKSGIIWSDEVCRYCFVITAFLAVPYCIRKRNLMRMDSVQKALPFKARFIVEAVVNAIIVAFFTYYSVTCITTIQKQHKMGAETEILLFPMYIIYIVIMACYVLSVIRAVQKGVVDMRTLIRGEDAWKAEQAAIKAAKAAKEANEE